MYDKHKNCKIVYKALIDNNNMIEFNTEKKLQAVLDKLPLNRKLTWKASCVCDWQPELGIFTSQNPEYIAKSMHVDKKYIQHLITSNAVKTNHNYNTNTYNLINFDYTDYKNKAVQSIVEKAYKDAVDKSDMKSIRDIIIHNQNVIVSNNDLCSNLTKYTIEHGNNDCNELLAYTLKDRKVINNADKKGNTALYYVVKSNNMEVAAIYLNHNADSTKRTACGLTVKDFAKSDNMKEVIERYSKSKNQSQSVGMHL